MTDLEYHIAQAMLAKLPPPPPSPLPSFDVIDLIAVVDEVATEDVVARVEKWCQQDVPGCRKMLEGLRMERERSRHQSWRMAVTPPEAIVPSGPPYIASQVPLPPPGLLTPIAQLLHLDFEANWPRFRDSLLNGWLIPLLECYDLGPNHSVPFLEDLKDDLRVNPVAPTQHFRDRLRDRLNAYSVAHGGTTLPVFDEERIAVRRWKQLAEVARQRGSASETDPVAAWRLRMCAEIETGNVTRFAQLTDSHRLGDNIPSSLRQVMEEELKHGTELLQELNKVVSILEAKAAA